MWTTAELIVKKEEPNGFLLTVLYGTDDVPPVTVEKAIFLGPGQTEATFKAAVVQQLADLNVVETQAKKDLKTVVDAIPVGPVATSVGPVDPADPLDPGGVIATP